MCGCGTSFGKDRFGPQYRGRYSVLGAQPAGPPVPWLQSPETKVDPSCPGCRVGAYAAGEASPPIPFGQDYVMQMLQHPPLQSAPPLLQPQPAFWWPRQLVPVSRLR